EPQPVDGEDAPAAEGEFEHRYKTLQGMYNAEKRRSTALEGRVEGMENMLAQLQTARDVSPQEDNDEPTQPESLISESEIEDYGSDLIDVMKRAAREAVQSEFDELRAENNQLKSLVGGVGQKMEYDDRTRMYAHLDTIDGMANWRDTNRDPAFLEWLEHTDIYSGEPRNTLLQKAFTENDASRVSRFFQGYLEEVAAVNQAAPNAPPAKPNGQGQVGLETLVAPGAGHSGSADIAKDQGRIWKESDIGAFYNAAREGRFKGRE
ncbi:unnamed protein product, partial [marine sediment metagenome]